MLNSNSNFVIKDTIKEIFRLKPQKKRLSTYNKNNNDISTNRQSNRNKYLTINLEKANQDSETILISPIYQTIRYDNKKVISTNNSLMKNRNIFLGNDNNSRDNKNKNLYKTPNIKIRNRLIFKDKVYMNLINGKSNKNEKLLKNSESVKCFTENSKTLNKKKKIIFPIHQNILHSNKSCKGKYIPINDNIQNANRINGQNNEEEINLSKKFNKINKIMSKKDITAIKENYNSNNKIKRKKLKYINVNDEKSVNVNDNYNKKLLFQRINNDSVKYKNKNFNKSLNEIIKSKTIQNIKKLYRNKINSKENITNTKSFKSTYTSTFSKNSIYILIKIFKKRRIKIWKDIKYHIFGTNYYNNNIFNVQSISYNNFQIKNNFIKEQLLDDIIQDNPPFLNDRINSKKNIYTKEINEIFNYHENDNNFENSTKNNILDNSVNQELKSKLKTIYLKYLFEKNNNRNKHILLKSLYKININKIIINNNENRKNHLLKKIIERQEQKVKNILRNFFIKFHFLSKLSEQQRSFFCFKDFQDDFILMQKLYWIIYRKEKYNVLSLKKYFDIFRKNTIIIKNNRNGIEEIVNNKILINKRNRKLKLIITKISKHNNIIIKNILKQWLLRSKIFKLNDGDNINNIRKKNIQQEDLIKGINKLNYIFNNYKDDNDTNINKENKKICDINEQKEINIMNNEKENDLIQKDIYLKKLYIEKYKTDSIIEEKEEEQTEE